MTLFRDLSVTHIFLLPQFSLKKDWRHPPTDKTYAGILSGQSRVYLYTNTPYIKAHCVLFRCCHFANFTQMIDDQRFTKSGINGGNQTSLFKTATPWWPWPWHLFWQRHFPLLFQPFAFPVMLIISSANDTGISDHLHSWTLPPDAGFTWWFRCVLPVSSTIWNQCSWGGNCLWIPLRSDGQKKSKNSKKGRGNFSGWSGFSREARGSASIESQENQIALMTCPKRLMNSLIYWKSNECGVNKPAQSHTGNTTVKINPSSH